MLDVAWDHVRSVAQCGEGLRGTIERQGAARRDAQFHERVVTRGAHGIQDVAPHVVR